MKVKVSHEPKQFNPIELEITIESQEEANFFESLFNWLPVCDVMREYCRADPESIRRALNPHGNDCDFAKIKAKLASAAIRYNS